MADNVIWFPGETTLEIPPRRVIEAALDTEFSEVVVIGIRKDRSLYLASSHDTAEAYLTINIARRALEDLSSE